MTILIPSEYLMRISGLIIIVDYNGAGRARKQRLICHCSARCGLSLCDTPLLSRIECSSIIHVSVAEDNKTKSLKPPTKCDLQDNLSTARRR